jgi:hypothetical protein
MSRGTFAYAAPEGSRGHCRAVTEFQDPRPDLLQYCPFRPDSRGPSCPTPACLMTRSLLRGRLSRRTTGGALPVRISPSPPAQPGQKENWVMSLSSPSRCSVGLVYALFVGIANSSLSRLRRSDTTA